MKRMILLLVLLMTVSCAHMKEHPAQVALGLVGIVVGVSVADSDVIGGALGWCVGDSVGQLVDHANSTQEEDKTE